MVAKQAYNITFLDTPAGVVPQTNVAGFYENILSQKRQAIINERLYQKFQLAKGPSKTYTHGLLSIATVAKKLGHTVTYYHLGDLALDAAITQALQTTDILCFSCKTTTINQCLQMAQAAKLINPQLVTIFGGPHPTFNPAEVLSHPGVDLVCLGEGEVTFAELLNSWPLIGNKANLAAIKGIAYLDQGTCITTEPRPLIADLNAVEWVDYTILPGDIRDFYLYLETRRGCPFSCAYCANPRIWQKCLRTLDAEVAYARLKNIASVVKPGSMIHIANPSFGFTKEDMALCQLLAQDKLELYFSVDLCASLMTPASIKAMYDAGCRMFSIGMESASDQVLAANHRPSFTLVREALTTIRQTCDAFIKGYFVVGLPGETEESARFTKDTIMELLTHGLVDMVCEHVFVPYPGCDVFHHPDRYDYKIYSYDWSVYDSRSFPLPGESNSFSMSRAYLAYIDLIASQCEFYGMTTEQYFDGQFNAGSKVVSFLQQKKHLV